MREDVGKTCASLILLSVELYSKGTRYVMGQKATIERPTTDARVPLTTILKFTRGWDIVIW